MKVLSNKEIYALLKILNSKKSKSDSKFAIEFDKHFDLSELKHLQDEINLAEHKSVDEILTIDTICINAYGQEILTGYKVTITDIKSIISYSKKYIEALETNNLVGLSDTNKLSALAEDLRADITNKTNIENYSFTELKYMPVVLYAYVNELLELKSITSSKYRLTNSDLRGDDICLRDLPPTIQTFGINIVMKANTSTDEDLLNAFNNLISIAMKSKSVEKIDFATKETKGKNDKSNKDKKEGKPKKPRTHFSSTIQDFYILVRKHARDGNYTIYPSELIGENKLYPNIGALRTAKGRLNEQCKEILKDDTIELLKFDRISECYIIENIWDNKTVI